jgi:hypothetical protein
LLAEANVGYFVINHNRLQQRKYSGSVGKEKKCRLKDPSLYANEAPEEEENTAST